MSQVPVIAIDGPSGSGKGTLAQMLARHLGWHLLDSGALYRVLRYFAGTEEIGALLAARLLGLLLLSFASILLLSNIITALSSFFLARDLDLLVSSPVDWLTLYVAKLLETVLHSSWMVVLLALPMLAAYGVAYEGGLTFALVALAGCIAFGLFYRISMALFFVGFAYVFLLEQARYLNHFYLITLLSFLLIFVPAHRALSLDALLRPNIRSSTAPTWSLWLLRAQIMIVYVFGGIAKLNSDWLQGEPMRMWLAARTDFPIIGAYFTEEWMVYLFSYGGMLFDLLFPFLVLWGPTRIPALLVSIAFHLTNTQLFNIGVFPWMMIAANVLFLPPEWFRLPFARSLSQDVGPVGATHESPLQFNTLTSGHRLALTLLAIYLLAQILVPLRHHLYAGDVQWTEEGHRFSWRMKLRDKEGDTRFFIFDPQTGTGWEADPLQYLTDWQYEEMTGRPDMILQFAHFLADDARSQGHENVEVRVWDSTAELRYLVLPERPAGTEGWSEDELAAIVTRDAMVGVAQVKVPAGGSR